MTGNDYVKYAMRTNDGKHRDRLNGQINTNFIIDVGSLMNGVLGLNGEAGEVADLVKKGIFHEKGLDIEHLTKELGDVMWYIALICDSTGIDLDTVLEKNVEKLMARYPDGFDTYRANHRVEGDI